MKTIFQYLLLTAACAALGACQDFSDDTAFTPETPELSFVETSITAEKATKDYELSIKSNLPWRIECDKDWVSFDPSYGQGDATITVTVAANRTLDERTATISAYVIIGQAAGTSGEIRTRQQGQGYKNTSAVRYCEMPGLRRRNVWKQKHQA